jgi:hypothetical protein
VLKLMSGVLTIALLATGCSSSTDPELSAAAAPQRIATTSEAGSRPIASTSPRPTAARARTGSARVEPRAAAPVRTVERSAYREFTLPVGTTLPLELRSSIGSDVSEVEDTVRATLRKDVTIEGQEVLPAGTEFAGHVTEAERAGRVKGRARVAFRFTSLRHDDERMSLRTEPIVREAEATKGEDATKIGIGAGAGAVIGAVVGGKSGAAKGAVIGGAAGTGAVVATRGKEVRFESGTDIPVRLAAPLSIRVRVQ